MDTITKKAEIVVEQVLYTYINNSNLLSSQKNLIKAIVDELKVNGLLISEILNHTDYDEQRHLDRIKNNI